MITPEVGSMLKSSESLISPQHTIGAATRDRCLPAANQGRRRPRPAGSRCDSGAGTGTNRQGQSTTGCLACQQAYAPTDGHWSTSSATRQPPKMTCARCRVSNGHLSAQNDPYRSRYSSNTSQPASLTTYMAALSCQIRFSPPSVVARPGLHAVDNDGARLHRLAETSQYASLTQAAQARGSTTPRSSLRSGGWNANWPPAARQGSRSGGHAVNGLRAAGSQDRLGRRAPRSRRLIRGLSASPGFRRAPARSCHAAANTGESATD